MSNVYFLKPDGYKFIPDVLNKDEFAHVVKKDDLVAIKVHFGEKGNRGYVRAKSIKPIIKVLKRIGAYPFVTDANTIYRGERTDAVHHLSLAAEHEFHPKYLGAPVVIADGLRGNSYKEVEVGLKHFKKVKIAEAIYHADSLVVISHFKGHALAGFGGAIKNLGMGCAARAGKYEQHNSIVPSVNASLCTACAACIKWCGGGALTLKATIMFDSTKCIGCGQCVLACNFKVFSLPWNENASVVQEKIAEYAAGVLKNKRAVYINFLTFITSYCDCFKTTHGPIIPDIGILISTDPVAIDRACLDLIKKHAGRDLMKEATGIDGQAGLDYAEGLGLGSQRYTLFDNG